MQVFFIIVASAVALHYSVIQQRLLQDIRLAKIHCYTKLFGIVLHVYSFVEETYACTICNALVKKKLQGLLWQ